ncbi:hypothetical protein JW824_05220 [bacterium]|nr:hypothetical protein [bacterium]RQV96626.1 MAG: hypothetical protein EH221_04670 [bacterium]
MNIKKWIFLSIVCGFMLFLTSCYDLTTSTQIFPDGSCTRTIEFVGIVEDESDIINGPYPIPQDSSWTVTYGDENHPRKSFQKRFRHVSDLNAELADKPDTLLQIHISVQLQKKFRWFNTYFRYQETYHTADPYGLVPINDYLSEEELELYYLHGDTLDLEERLQEWYIHSSIEYYFQQLQTVVDSLNLQDLTAEQLNSKKALLLEMFDKRELNETGDRMVNQHVIEFFGSIMMSGFMTNDQPSPFNHVKMLESLLGTSSVRLMSEQISRIDAEIEQKNRYISSVSDREYTNQVTMPGLILDTNAKELEGSTVRWQFDGNQFFWEDHPMWVESRVVNQWAMIVTGAVCLSLIAGLLFGTILRRRRQI